MAAPVPIAPDPPLIRAMLPVHLVAEHGPLAIQAIAEHGGIPVSTTYRYVPVLIRAGYLAEASAQKGWTPATFGLGRLALQLAHAGPLEDRAAAVRNVLARRLPRADGAAVASLAAEVVAACSAAVPPTGGQS